MYIGLFTSATFIHVSREQLEFYRFVYKPTFQISGKSSRSSTYNIENLWHCFWKYDFQNFKVHLWKKLIWPLFVSFTPVSLDRRKHSSNSPSKELRLMNNAMKNGLLLWICEHFIKKSKVGTWTLASVHCHELRIEVRELFNFNFF